MDLVIASTNMNKVREFRSLLKSFGWDVLSLRDFPEYVPPEETGVTFQENAQLKAKSAAASLGRWVLADDSGLVVPSLKGAPGVHSSSYAGNGVTDLENRVKLLSAMKGFQDTDRFAYFECCICIVSPEGEMKSFRGLCEGSIIEEAKGGNGFGYDAIFRKHEYNKTFAELDEEVKNKISHRRKAFDKALIFLESLQEHAILD
ncbi:MAG: RdgB/HAM1 family non-canonical purine NTP pyrophosphatase [Chlamydiota bacterium]